MRSLNTQDHRPEYRDMLVTARDRIQKLKSAGKSAQEAAATKPLADQPGPKACSPATFSSKSCIERSNSLSFFRKSWAVLRLGLTGPHW